MLIKRRSGLSLEIKTNLAHLLKIRNNFLAALLDASHSNVFGSRRIDARDERRKRGATFSTGSWMHDIGAYRPSYSAQRITIKIAYLPMTMVD